ncbi:MAG: 4Fe-4S binding protein [Candidatus Aureabacteria bacterium]|nr:4Fe-4S binding protein [Candidatus Auribacterota bacterium]
MYKIDRKKCVGCGACVDVCPAGAISIVDDKAVIDADKCMDCGECMQICPQDAIYPETQSRQNFSPNQRQIFPGSGFGMGGGGKGFGRGMGRGLGRGPRNGRGGGRGR